MIQSPKTSSSVTLDTNYITLMDKCSTVQELGQIHAHMIKSRLVLDPIPASRLLVSLCKLSDPPNLVYATKVFDEMSSPTTFMWNTIIRAFSNSMDPEESLKLYSQMLSCGAEHNLYTFPFLLKACSNLPYLLEETKQIHCSIVKTGFASDIYTANSLIHVYAKYGNIVSSRKLFDRMPSRDDVSWNSMIDGYVKNRMIEFARELFDLMENKNVVTWTSIIAGYVECGCFKEALELFRDMQSKQIDVDSVVLASAISACAHLGALDQGRWIHGYIKRKKIVIDQVLGCVLVDMYAKCGELEDALEVFNGMKQRNVHVWTAMITGFAVHGYGREALVLFANMQNVKIKPNAITCTALLTACSHSGLVEKGKSFFNRMEKDFAISPTIEHYGCMVDLLGRAGLFHEAEALITAMPMSPNIEVWGALFNACHVHKNFALGKRVGKILIELEPEHGGRYIQLARIFGAEGRWDEAANVRELMKGRGVGKLPGCSSISLDGSVHEFVSGDWSHSHSAEIYAEWQRIVNRLKKEGYRPMTEDLMLDLEDEEKETAVHFHGEKLAAAFGLLRTDPGTTIRIVKNLRVCKDCHSAMKLISKVYDRKIIMRDRSRFHCFTDGSCSCRDYW